MRRIRKILYRMQISQKLITAFVLTSLLSFATTMYMNYHINQRLGEIEQVYRTNNQMNQISEALEGIQNQMQEYLDTRNSEALTGYYSYEQSYRGLIENLNDQILEDEAAIMERNIRGLSETYLEQTAKAIEAKRARNIESYKQSFDEASGFYRYLSAGIFSLNNLRLEENSRNYEALAVGLRTMEQVTALLNVAVAFINILFLCLLIRQIIRPLRELSETADRVAGGDFSGDSLTISCMDEVGVAAKAFNKMVVSLRRYMEQLKESIQKENEAKERELLMESNFKEAQLKYYQAQIHPHFLFNTLNAGAQLAMMEDAQRTESFIQHMSEFFRYCLKNPDSDVTLEEEINLVENYIYIMNVRFAGEIGYEKEIRCELGGVRVPSMILQPIVENAIRYGIRDIDWEGRIRLTIDKKGDSFWIQVQDNGVGMEKERLEELRRGEWMSMENEDDSHGIGLGNVTERLSLYYRESNLLQIDSEGTGKGTTVTIQLPFEREKRGVGHV